MHLYSSFSMDLHNFFVGANLYQKLLFFSDFGGRATMVKVRTTVGTWGTLPHAKFCKNCLRGYTHFGQYIPQITNFCDFEGSNPTFKATAEKWSFGTRVQSWETLPHAKFDKNPLRGHTPLRQIVTKKHRFWRFWGL